jgi:hypothetical protein
MLFSNRFTEMRSRSWTRWGPWPYLYMISTLRFSQSKSSPQSSEDVLLSMGVPFFLLEYFGNCGRHKRCKTDEPSWLSKKLKSKLQYTLQCRKVSFSRIGELRRKNANMWKSSLRLHLFSIKFLRFLNFWNLGSLLST